MNRIPVIIFAWNMLEAQEWAKRHPPGDMFRYIYADSLVRIEGLYLETDQLYIVELPGFSNRLDCLTLWEAIRRLSPYIALTPKGKSLVHYPSFLSPIQTI